LFETRAPGGYALAGPRAVTIVAGGPNEVTVTNVQTHPLAVFKVDEFGAPLTDRAGGACFQVTAERGSDEACDSDDGANDGVITLAAVAGENGLTETRAPFGFQAADFQFITVAADSPNEVTVVNAPLEQLTIHKVDEHGAPLTDEDGGACFAFYGMTHCDGDDGANDGTITIPSPPGEVYVQETRAPAGYFAPGYDIWVTVVAGGPNELTVVNEPLPTLTIFKVDETGAPLTDDSLGACFKSWINAAETYCDADDGVNDGTITVAGSELYPGSTFTFMETRAPDGYVQSQVEYYVPIDAGPNEVTITNLPAEEVVTIFKVDENGDPLTDAGTGACFTLVNIGEYESFACDADDGSNDGTIVLRGLPGSPELREVRPPEGYWFAWMDDYVTIVAGGTNEFTIANVPFVELTIHKVDEYGEPLTDATEGACFVLSSTYRCDGSDGVLDGTITLWAVPGEYDLHEDYAPVGYAPAPDQTITLVAGQANDVTIANEPLQTLTVYKVDEAGNPLTDETYGACFAVESASAFDVGCDYQDGVNDGVISLRVPSGTYTLREQNAPAGYWPAESLPDVTVTAGGLNEITVANAPLQALTVYKVDENGDPLFGPDINACFEIRSVESEWAYSSDCDGGDGANDGIIHLTAPPGEHVLVEWWTPPGYWAAAPTEVTIVAGGPNEVTVANLPLLLLTINKVDARGEPLAGACFRIDASNGNSSTACDDHDGAKDGTITLGVRPGTYLLEEVWPPPGYDVAEPQEVTIVEGRPNEVTVVNRLDGEVPPVTPTATPTPTLVSNGNSNAAKACQHRGWQVLQGADGERFKNQGQCVRYAARGGTLEPIPTPTS
jgi:uncharacterized surface anchored protein